MYRVVAPIIVLLTIAIVSYAQTTAGNLDPAFGTGGIVRTDFAGNIAGRGALAFELLRGLR